MTFRVTSKTTIKLAELKKLKKRIRHLGEDAMQVGWFDGKTHPGTLEEDNPLPEATVAAIVHNGAKVNNGFGKGIKIEIPSRPFFVQASGIRGRNMKSSLRKRLGEIMRGRRPSGALLSIGRDFRRDAKKTMATWPTSGIKSRRNAKSTIRRKGFDRALHETGHLRKSMDVRKVKRGSTP